MIQNTATKAKATASALKSSKLAIQGVVARFRSVRQGQLRRDSRKDEKPVVGIDALDDLSRNTKGAMLAARGSLAPDQYEEFLDYAFGNLPSVSYPPRHYYNVQGLHDSSVIPLEHELRWIVSWLNRHASEIERHLERVAKIDRLVLMGRFADALVEVDKHIDDEGHTLWAVQLALALEQRSGGLEAQKRRHEELRRRNRRGLLAYVSYMTSTSCVMSASPAS